MWPKSYSSGWTSTEWVDKWKLPGSFLISNLKNKVNFILQGLNSPGFKEAPLLVHSNGRFYRIFHHSHFVAPLIILAWKGKRHNLMDGLSFQVLKFTWMSIPRNSHFILGMLTFIRTGILHVSKVTRCETSISCFRLTFLLDHYLPLITPTWHQDWQSREAQWQAWRWWRGRSRWRWQLLSLWAVSGPSAPSCKCPSAWCRTP